jgi:hypothetical protein
MSIVKIAAAAAVAGLGFLLWHQHRANVEAAAVAALTDEHGFVSLAQPQGADPKTVWIVAAVNCPKDGARRADDLARQLGDRSMSFDRRSGVTFSLSEDDLDLYERTQKIMNSDTPIVFVNGRMKSNPELEEILAEYEAAQH